MPPTETATDAALRGYFDADVDGKVILDREGRTLFVNDRHLEFWGVSRAQHGLTAEERSGTIRARVVDPEVLNGTAAARLDPVNTFTWIIPMNDGRTVEVRSAPIFDGAGQHLGRGYTTRDITTQLHAETALRESESRNRALIASLHVGVVLLGADGRVVFTNQEALRILGASESDLVGKTAEEINWGLVREDGSDVTDAERPAALAFATGEPVHNLVYGIRRPHNGLRWMLVNAEPLVRESFGGVVVTFQDVTDRREARIATAQADRDETVSVLAGGVAHKLNNALTTILGNAYIAGTTPGMASDAESAISEVVEAANGAADVVADLLSLAVGGLETDEETDIPAAIRGALANLSADDRTRVSIQFAEGLPHVCFAGGSLERAIGSLLANALEVSPSAKMTVQREERGVQFLHRAAAPGPVKKGSYLVIEVTDNGPGIAPAIEAQLFKPFASMKGAGRGLGLSAAAGIMAARGGFVELVTRPSGGTSARLLIPLR